MEDPFLDTQFLRELGPAQALNQDYKAELDRIAEAYAQHEAESPSVTSHLLSKEQAVERFKRNFKEAVRLDEQQALLKQAVKCIVQEGKKYLSTEEWEHLSTEVLKASDALAKLTYQDPIPEKLFPALGMTEQGMNEIDAISREKYKEENYSSALALNALLTTLDAGALIYWLHLGICYQDSGFYEKAIKAYSICHILNPLHIPAWLFCSECYCKAHNKGDAKIEYEAALQLISFLSDKAFWQDHLRILKKELQL